MVTGAWVMQVVIFLLKLLKIQAEQVKTTGKESASDFYDACYTMEAFESIFLFNFNSVYMLEVVRCIPMNRKKEKKGIINSIYIYIYSIVCQSTCNSAAAEGFAYHQVALEH